MPRKKAQRRQEDVFEVEKILDCRTKENFVQYLVQWRGYSISEATWEPISNLDGCEEILQRFEQSLLLLQQPSSNSANEDKKDTPNHINTKSPTIKENTTSKDKKDVSKPRKNKKKSKKKADDVQKEENSEKKHSLTSNGSILSDSFKGDSETDSKDLSWSESEKQQKSTSSKLENNLNKSNEKDSLQHLPEKTNDGDKLPQEHPLISEKEWMDYEKKKLYDQIELSLREFNAIGTRVKLYWDKEQEWFWGKIYSYKVGKQMYVIVYDDGDITEEKYEDIVAIKHTTTPTPLLNKRVKYFDYEKLEWITATVDSISSHSKSTPTSSSKYLVRQDKDSSCVSLFKEEIVLLLQQETKTKDMNDIINVPHVAEKNNKTSEKKNRKSQKRRVIKEIISLEENQSQMVIESSSEVAISAEKHPINDFSKINNISQDKLQPNYGFSDISSDRVEYQKLHEETIHQKLKESNLLNEIDRTNLQALKKRKLETPNVLQQQESPNNTMVKQNHKLKLNLNEIDEDSKEDEETSDFQTKEKMLLNHSKDPKHHHNCSVEKVIQLSERVSTNTKIELLHNGRVLEDKEALQINNHELKQITEKNNTTRWYNRILGFNPKLSPPDIVGGINPEQVPELNPEKLAQFKRWGYLEFENFMGVDTNNFNEIFLFAHQQYNINGYGMRCSPPQMVLVTDPKLLAIHAGLTGFSHLYCGVEEAKMFSSKNFKNENEDSQWLEWKRGHELGYNMNAFLTMIYVAGPKGEIESCTKKHKKIKLLAGFHNKDVWDPVLKELEGSSGSFVERINSCPNAQLLIKKFINDELLKQVVIEPQTGTLYVVHAGVPIDFVTEEKEQCNQHVQLLVFPSLGPRLSEEEGLLPNSPQMTRALIANPNIPLKKAKLFGDAIEQPQSLTASPFVHSIYVPSSPYGRAVMCVDLYTQENVCDDLSVLFPPNSNSKEQLARRENHVSLIRKRAMEQLNVWYKIHCSYAQ